MGHASTKSGLDLVTKRTESRMGKLSVSGRYHRLPKKLEDDYVMENKVLGSGYNGAVHLARDKQSHHKFAVKAFKLHGVSREKKEELETECEIFLGMDHPHVARLTDVYEDEEFLNLVMECMEGGELFQRVTERKRFSEKDASEAAFQMLLAVNYIHEHGVVHRDLKLENFLYESKDSDKLKLIDFGFSHIWDHCTKMSLSCGTLAYAAPEVLEKSYTSQCDLWSLGVIIFILLVGYMPFAGSESHQVASIKAGKFTYKKEQWQKVSKEANDFVVKLLNPDPQKRMTAEEALQHPWIQKRKELHEREEHLDQDTVNALTQFGQASSFRRACMSVMAWSLTNEERAQVRDAFLELDHGHHGTISLKDFRQILEEKFHLDDEAAVQAFKALDMTHHEEIHYSDFLAAMVSSRIKLHDDLLHQTFRRFDTDNTGFITANNLRQVLGESFEGHEIDELLAEADFAHDGKIDYTAFVAYLKDGKCADKHQEAAGKIIDDHIARKAQEDGRKDPKMRMKANGTAESKAGEEKPPEKKKCCSVQ